MSKKLNISVKQAKSQVEIVNQLTSVIGKLIKIRDLIEQLEDEGEKSALNRVLTDSLSDFVDEEYLSDGVVKHG